MLKFPAFSGSGFKFGVVLGVAEPQKIKCPDSLKKAGLQVSGLQLVSVSMFKVEARTGQPKLAVANPT